MKYGSTLLLKLVLFLFSGAVTVLCFFILKVLLTEEVGLYMPILIGMLVAAFPFFEGVYQTFKLLHLIDKKKAFSKASIKSLRVIKYCGITISTIYGLGMPYIFYVADLDDAPGVVLLGLIFTFAPMGAAVMAEVLERLLQNAHDLKTENELTV